MYAHSHTRILGSLPVELQRGVGLLATGTCLRSRIVADSVIILTVNKYRLVELPSALLADSTFVLSVHPNETVAKRRDLCCLLCQRSLA